MPLPYTNFINTYPAVLLAKSENTGFDFLCSKICKRLFNFGRKMKRNAGQKHEADSWQNVDEQRKIDAFKELRNKV